jgi:hypothetical protein
MIQYHPFIRRYVVRVTEKASLNKLHVNKQTNKQILHTSPAQCDRLLALINANTFLRNEARVPDGKVCHFTSAVTLR